MSEQQPSKVIYRNNGQTKVTLIGRLAFMEPEEFRAEYQRGLDNGNPRLLELNNLLCDIVEEIAIRKAAESDAI